MKNIPDIKTKSDSLPIETYAEEPYLPDYSNPVPVKIETYAEEPYLPDYELQSYESEGKAVEIKKASLAVLKIKN